MGMTITEKNMARHAGLDVVKPGQIIADLQIPGGET